MNIIKDKVALVTGTSSKKGMGHAIALKLAEEGAHVIIVDKYKVPQIFLEEEKGWGGIDEIATEIRNLGREALPYVGDISDSKEVNRIVDKSIAKFGKIDILVHCAAVRGPIGVPIIDLPEEDWKTILEINTTGAFLISKAVAKSMVAKGEGGKIVLIASLAGHTGSPGSGAYCVSKFGVVGLVKTMALELAKYNIYVNAISPGGVITNLRDKIQVEMAKNKGIPVEEARRLDFQKYIEGIPLGRLGSPDEIADLALFLASPLSSYITGEDISISGGRVTT